MIKNFTMKKPRKKRSTSDEIIIANNIGKIDSTLFKNVKVVRQINQTTNKEVAYLSFYCIKNHKILVKPQNIRNGYKINCDDCKNNEEKNIKIEKTIADFQKETESIFPYKYQILTDFKKGKRTWLKMYCNDCKEYFEINSDKLIHSKQMGCSKECRNKRKREKEREYKIKFYSEKLSTNPKCKNGNIFIDDIEYEKEAVWVITKCFVHPKIERSKNRFRATSIHEHVPCLGCIENNKQNYSPKKYSEEKVLKNAKEKLNNSKYNPIKASHIKTSSGGSYWTVYFKCKEHLNNAPERMIFSKINQESIPCKDCSDKKLKNDADKFLELGEIIHPQYKYNEKEVRSAFRNNIYKIPVICPKPGHGKFFTNYELHIKNKGGFCPSCITSKGQEQTKKILTEYKVKFEYNKTFSDLEKLYPQFKSVMYKQFRPDFYLPDINLIIEYDGIYHFDKKKHRDPKDFYQTIKNDYLKNRFAIKQHINLFRICCLKTNNDDYDYNKELISEAINLRNVGSKLYNKKELLIKKSNMYAIVKKRKNHLQKRLFLLKRKKFTKNHYNSKIFKYEKM